MINLNTFIDNSDYFILIDNQGGNFGGSRIFESIQELASQFKDWADVDSYEDPTLKDWSIGDCLSNWDLLLKHYNGSDFIRVNQSNTDKNKKNILSYTL